MTSRECKFFVLELWFEMWSILAARNQSTAHVGKPSFAYYQLAQMYQGNKRHYHDLLHIDESVDWWMRVGHLMNDPWACLMVLMYHDCVYDPRAADNEAMSADEMERMYLTLGLFRDSTLLFARHCLRATDHAQLSRSNDVQLVCDIDLIRLAESPEEFDRYTDLIRREYAQVSDQDFYRGRIEILERLAKRGVFQSEYFKMFEDKAQENIRRSVAQMRKMLAVSRK